MIPREGGDELEQKRITRTCGGDPFKVAKKYANDLVLPAHAGVIPEFYADC